MAIKNLIFISIIVSIISAKYKILNPLPKYPSILQISTRPYLYSLSKLLGKEIKTLKDIPNFVFKEFQEKQFDYVWFMGVWQVGPYGISHDRSSKTLVEGFKKLLDDYVSEDAIGSPYAITDYICNKELCPNGNDDLVWLKIKLHAFGIRLMLDFVPNHLALDSPLIDENMNYFIRAPKGSQPPYDESRYFKNGIAYGNMQYSSAWTDVAQLNYYNPELRNLMKNRLKTVAKYADGIRCDMAYIMLNDYFYGTWNKELDSWGWTKPAEEFWLSAIKETKNEYPETMFLAEVYGDYVITLINLGFDYTYDKELLDRFKSGHMDNIRAWIKSTNDYSTHVCRFIENHDDNRAVAMFNGDIRRTDITALATYTLPGMKFYFQDQWFGYKNKLDVHLRRAKSEEKSVEAQKFYNKFFDIINTDIFRNGVFTILNAEGPDSWRFVTWSWKSTSGKEKLLVIINYSDHLSGCQVKISDITGSGTIVLRELLSDKVYERNRDDLRNIGLSVLIDDFDGQIFLYD